MLHFHGSKLIHPPLDEAILVNTNKYNVNSVCAVKIQIQDIKLPAVQTNKQYSRWIQFC